jgi:hypothetical protein
MVESFTTALLEAQKTAVPKTVPFRYSLVLTPEIKALIVRKNNLRPIAQRTKNRGDKRNYETLNSIVTSFRKKTFGKNFAKIQSNHKSLFNFIKLIKNKSRGVPALKVDGVTLLTGPEQAETIAS